MHEGERRVFIQSRKKNFVIDMDPSSNQLLKFMLFDGFKACGGHRVDPAIIGVQAGERGDSDTISAVQNEEEEDDSDENEKPKATSEKWGKDFGEGFLYENLNDEPDDSVEKTGI
jgi:hypothetical protein